MKSDVFENEFLQSQLLDYMYQEQKDKVDLQGGMAVMLMLASLLREHGKLSYTQIGQSMEQLASQIKSFDLH